MAAEPDGQAVSHPSAGPSRTDEPAWPLQDHRLMELLDNTRGVVWVKSPDGRILFANRYVEKLLGRPRAEIVGRRMAELLPAEEAERFARVDREVLADGREREYDDSATSADGRRDFQVFKFALRDGAGVPCAVAAICTDVTGRRRAEALARASDARLRLLSDALPALVCYVDAEERYRFVSQSHEQWFGRPRADWENRTLSEVLGAEAYGTIRDEVQKALAGERVSFQVRMPYATGAREVEAHFVPDPGADGKTRGYFGLITDVSERRAQEERLRLQSAALEATADAVVITDRAGRIEWANPAFAELSGYGLGETLGRQPGELLRSGVHDAEFYRSMWETILAGRTWRGEMVNRRRDGTLYDEEQSITPVRDGTGEISHFVAIKQDVTESRRAATAMQRFVAGSPTVLYALRPIDGGYSPEWVSENVSALTGYSVAEAMRRGWWLERVHPDDRERVAAGQPWPAGTGQRVTEYRFRHADERYLWIRDEQRANLDEAGKVIDVLGSWSDVTERVQLEVQYRQAQKMEAVGRLAGGVAHDFNNLLTVISGNAELLSGTLPEEGAGRGLLGEIREAADRAASLTRRLLAFSRSQVVAPKVLDLNAAIGSIERLLRRLLGEDVQVETRLGADAGHVRFDPGQLEQVILNLAVNARDAMPHGGRLEISSRQVELDVDACRGFAERRPGRYALLSIADSGCGMSAEVQARIFEPFFTTKSQGTGLGLATVFGIVHQGEGRIEVASEEGAGSRFDVYLPQVPAPPETAAEPAATLAPSPQGSEMILLVEDEEALRRLGRLSLERLGFRVLTAADGREALDLAESAGEAVDLLVTDLVMPAMGGRELADLLRRRRPRLRVLFMSGYAGERAADEFPPDAADFLQKPFRLAELAARVREILDRPAEKR